MKSLHRVVAVVAISVTLVACNSPAPTAPEAKTPALAQAADDGVVRALYEGENGGSCLIYEVNYTDNNPPSYNWTVHAKMSFTGYTAPPDHQLFFRLTPDKLWSSASTNPYTNFARFWDGNVICGGYGCPVSIHLEVRRTSDAHVVCSGAYWLAG